MLTTTSVDNSKLTPPSMFKIYEPLDRALEQASDKRKEIFAELKLRQWFLNTPSELHVELANLPADPKCNFDGFLEDLAKRPEQLGNVTVMSLNRLAKGNFAIIPIFDVVNHAGQPFTYEYVSWRYGPRSGAKGLVLVENDGKPTHFVILSGEKFATGKRETDCPGGFMDIGVDGVNNVLQRIKREIQEELGLDEVKLSRDPIDLGPLRVDPGMTNNSPSMFIAHIDAKDATNLGKSDQNGDPYELQSNVIIYPIEQLPEVVGNIKDSFFLACVAKGWASGVIPLLPVENKDSHLLAFSNNAIAGSIKFLYRG